MDEGRRAEDLPVLICGGGIGGLSAALALARRGLPVKVLEAEAEFGESGAGIQIGPNGSRILRSWGLGDALGRLCAQPCAIHIGDGLSGRRLASIPLGSIAEQRYGAPYYVAERRILHRLLLDAVRAQDGPEIITAFRVRHFENRSGDVIAATQDGRSLSGSALIGADGVHSGIRSGLFGVQAGFSGRNAWRATAPLEAADAENADVHLWMGPNAHLVHYGCGPAGPLNAVAVITDAPASPGWGTAGDAGRLMTAFADWASEPRRMLQRFSGWAVWPLLNLPPLPSWTAGRTALLGDAAHPIMPFLASGAVMALEDAERLGIEMARNRSDLPAALQRYEAARQGRVTRVKAAAERMGEIYHMAGPMRLARNLTLAALPSALLLARNDWLYSYDETANGRSAIR